MKEMLKKLPVILFAVALLLCMLPMSALAAQSGDYTYEVVNGKATVTDYTGGGGAITIPSKLGGYPVTAIGEEAFTYLSSLTSVTIPTGVTSIGNRAFFGCRNLTGVTIPTGVTIIGNAAFCECRSLVGVTIPSSVTTLGEEAFAGCSSLKSIAIPGGVAIVGDWVFSSCSSLTSVTMSAGVKRIGEGTFASCAKLTSVTIPNSVTSIGKQAFHRCDRLTSVTIPGSVTTIEEGAFGSCTNLMNITISEGVTSIGRWAFANCWGGLASVTIPGSVTSIGEQAFSGCGLLEYVIFKGNAPKMGEDVFAWALPGFTVYYPKGSTGYPNPWHGYPTAAYILPAAPAVKAASASYTSVRLTWGAVAGAEKYEVYRATSGNGPWTKLAETAYTSRADTGLTTGTAYYYKVKAYGTVITTKVYGNDSAVASARPAPAAPTVKAASASYTSVKLTWGAVAGANGYVVYRATSSNGTYTLAAVLPSGTTASYTNTGLTTGNSYYYKVRAYRTVGAAKVYGDYSAMALARPVPAAPASVKAASASYNSVRLTWGAVAGASGYVVYRATSSNGTYTLAAVLPSGSTASYTNAGLITGTTYYYKLRAYRTVGATKVYGDYSAVASARPVPAVPTGVKAARASATSIRLTWGAVAGASGYVVYQATSSTGDYTLAAVFPSGSTAIYTNAGLTTGKTYYYKVRAYRTVGTVKVYSDYSGTVSAKP